MKTALIIHGHFYQPPREDPSTGIVDTQTSAKPFKNWNEAIYRTCYKPNAYSRYLTDKGRVESIYNNYCTVSSNFGPTLLKWMDDEHHHFIDKLKEADKESIRRWGHSNFIAQTYNHTILPLASRKDKIIQIKWALEDYKSRFGHDSEGFWCSECAIDEETVDVLAENNIKFVILSPWQAESINGRNLAEGECAPSDRPFILKGKTKSISVFFYNGEFASGISFGHMLRDADELYRQITTYKKENNPKLLTWATDGEIYGHHEAFGDMALAALIKKVNDGDQFYFTNFAKYLEDNPPTETATLWLGEDGKGSSWSCSHGIKRWYTDCGCHTGGSDNWNQAWRTPLRRAFENLETKGREIFEDNIHRILGNDIDSENILINYGKVLSRRQTVDEYVYSLKTSDGRSLDYEDAKDIAVLLDSMKNIFFSFTSCGWFFNDISGIEPSQDISYAVYASTNLQKYTHNGIIPSLMRDLKEAKSNNASIGTGENIAKTFIAIIPAFARACGYFAMNRRIARQEDFEDTFGVFSLLSINDRSMVLKNSNTLEVFNLSYDAKLNSKGIFIIHVKNLKTGYDYSYEGSQISLSSLQKFANWVDTKIAGTLNKKTVMEIVESVENYIALADLSTNVSKEEVFHRNISIAINSFKSLALSNFDSDFRQTLGHLGNIARIVSKVGRPNDIESVKSFFNSKIEYYSDLFNKNNISEEQIDNMLETLRIARANSIDIDITELQNAVWNIISTDLINRFNSSTVEKLKIQLNFRTTCKTNFNKSGVNLDSTNVV